LLVLRSALVELGCKAVHGKNFKSLKALVSLSHLFNARLRVGLSHHFFVFDLIARHLLLMTLLKFNKLFLVDSLCLVLTISLAQYLNLECLFMGVLAHHTLELESVSVYHIILIANF